MARPDDFKITAGWTDEHRRVPFSLAETRRYLTGAIIGGQLVPVADDAYENANGWEFEGAPLSPYMRNAVSWLLAVDHSALRDAASILRGVEGLEQ
jgi:hypothetical protein